MIYIKKGVEPKSLTEYKKKKFAYYDGYKNKNDIRENLLKEQGYLCAYCMRRIDKKHMKIEHWKPEKLLTAKETLDYSNMLGCCLGHIDGTSGDDDTCDTKKGDTPIKVNPHDKSTINKIKYKTATGEIYSDDEQIDKDLNKILNLNSDKHMLKLNRKETLNQVISELSQMQKNGIWNDKILSMVKNKYELQNAQGMKKEYAGIVTWYLNKKLKNIK